MSDKARMNDSLSRGFLHQQHLKLGDMKPVQEIMYCARQKRAFLSLLLLPRAICIKCILLSIINGLCAGTLDFSGSALLQPPSLMLLTISLFFHA